MAFFTTSIILDSIGLVVALLVVAYTFIRQRYTYWKKLNVPTPLTPAQVPFGNTKKIIKRESSFGQQFREFYDEFKARGKRHGGFYFGVQHFYIPVEMDLVKAIIQTDFSHFVNHGTYLNERDDPLSGHLFSLEDQKWKNMRVKLTPTFTSGKMKLMFQTLADCTVGLKDLMSILASEKKPVDIKEILGRFTTDIIGSTAFGIECNSLKDPDSEFRKYGKMSIEPNALDIVKQLLQFMLPHDLLRFFHMTATPAKVSKFFLKAVKEVVEHREANNIYRKDFMHLLLQLKNRGKVSDDETIKNESGKNDIALTLNELSAQAFVFFLAGFETSSTTMTFALYEMATNQDIQQKVRNEINTVLAKHNNVISYDAIMEMRYMDRVLSETLRKYPPIPVLLRQCNKEWKVPKSNVVIEKGTNVAISALGIQNDPEYFPNPDKFDPERFTEEAKQTRPPLAWLPFGEGPRLCIGLRFGLMQSKVGLTAILKNYILTINKKTHLPLTMDPDNFITTAKGGIWLDVKPI